MGREEITVDVIGSVTGEFFDTDADADNDDEDDDVDECLRRYCCPSGGKPSSSTEWIHSKFSARIEHPATVSTPDARGFTLSMTT